MKSLWLTKMKEEEIKEKPQKEEQEFLIGQCAKCKQMIYEGEDWEIINDKPYHKKCVGRDEEMVE